MAGEAGAQISASEWDAFLLSSGRGQFQQSSLWAKAKAAQGWQPIRRGFRRQSGLAGGFQLLVRPTRLGRIGYIYKGPVLRDEDTQGIAAISSLIAETVRDQRLRALVIQPPDGSRLDVALLQVEGFLPNCLVKTISATLQIDLAPGLEEVRRKIRRSTRAEIRQASERGVRARQGGRADIGGFFDLMAATCARQQTSPSPADVASMEAVWDAFEPTNQVKLFLAECEGELVAGLWCIGFGRRMVAWKRGWTGRYPERNPNQLVTYEAIRWAIEEGYEIFDFDAVDRALAEAVLRGEPLSVAQKRSRHFINLAFGARAVLLPESVVYFPNPLVRSVYRGWAAFRYRVGASQNRAR